jgi:hypothetical protein
MSTTDLKFFHQIVIAPAGRAIAMLPPPTGTADLSRCDGGNLFEDQELGPRAPDRRTVAIILLRPHVARSQSGIRLVNYREF